MPNKAWDDLNKDAFNNGRENPEAILARIDERVKNMNEKLTFHVVSFEEHKIDDKKNFDILFNAKFYILGIGGALGGILSCATLVIMWVRH